MLVAVVLSVAALLSGCATYRYTSPKPAEEVAQCIAGGWGGVGATEAEVPTMIEPHECGYFVTFGLARPLFSVVIFGLKHPLHAVWAEVCVAPEGSATEYRRAA